MRKMFDDEFCMEDVKKYLKKLQKKDNNNIVACAAVIGVIVFIAAMIVVAVRLSEKAEEMEDEFAEGYCDEDGCYYADEADFE